MLDCCILNVRIWKENYLCVPGICGKVSLSLPPGIKDRKDVGCFCQPLDEKSYVSMIVSTLGEFAGLLLTF